MCALVVGFVRCRYWYPSGGSGAFAVGYFAHVVGQHRSDCVGGKSAGVPVAWLRLGEGPRTASETTRLTEGSIIRAKRAPLGWVSPIRATYTGGGLVQCLAWCGGPLGWDAARTLRMLTSRQVGS